MDHRRRPLKKTWLLLFYALGFAIVTSENVRAAGFFMQRPKLGMTLSYEFESEKRTGPDIDTDDSFHEFRQLLDIRTKGWAYHPAFAKYELGLQPTLSQKIETREEEDDSRRSRNAFLPAYFADVTVLPLKPYSLHLFGKRYEDTTTSAFAATTDTDTNIYGGDLLFKNRILPTTFSYARTSIDQSGFFDSDEDRDDFRITTRHQKGRSDTQAYSTYSDSDRTTDGTDTHVKTSNSELRNLFDITGKRKVMLNSFLTHRWSEQNSFDTSNLRWFEHLSWRHKKNLRTDYRLGYNEQETVDFKRKTPFFNAELQHLLYENLTTTLNGGGELNDFTGGSEDIYNMNLDFQYRRKIPWGWLNLNAGYDYNLAFRQGGEVSIQIINEPHVLVTGLITLLDNENVDPASVVVTNTTGSIVYVENTDYILTAVNSFIQISRTTFGAIADGQAVLVDYRYRSDSDYDDAVFGQTYAVDFLLWSALRLYYRFGRANQNILSGTPPENRVDDTLHAAEVRYNLGWTDTQFTFEDTDRESGVSTRQWKTKQTFVYRPVNRLYFRLSGYYGQTFFKDQDGDTQDLYGLRTDLTWTPTRWSRFRMEAYQDRISGDIEDTVNSVGTASLDLYYRIWRGKIFYRFLDQDNRTTNQRRRRHTVFVELVRLRF
jgi:hypothetical protein